MTSIMRYDAEHKQQTHDRLLKEAAKAIRRDGPHKVSVAGVMAKAGLTHGGFYAHFKNRDELVAEGVAQMFRESAGRFAQSVEGRTPREALLDYVDFYLSAAHRDSRSSGCPLPFLSADAPRLPTAARARFSEGVRGLEDRIAGQLAAMGRRDAHAEAGSLVAELVGALALARAEPDRDRADNMLARSRGRIIERFGLTN
jgi:TetR/AcrR family transcriptional regulator, transcriptional repressor for nem operon